ncbi:unnamed protein product [Moneuplotes crassus]|uniref:Uncharacterized protein n=1 Tax=Euplotes crassus TaxID=5936 RepID=A0AAD1XFZ1_EUPCR|nr:unnamed protein product [Moneuplotes crassus]
MSEEVVPKVPQCQNQVKIDNKEEGKASSQISAYSPVREFRVPIYELFQQGRMNFNKIKHKGPKLIKKNGTTVKLASSTFHKSQCDRKRSYNNIQKNLFEAEKVYYASRIESMVGRWSRRASDHHPTLNPISMMKHPSFNQTGIVTPKLNSAIETYLLSPGKDTFAGMKPVFTNNTNQLKKGENQIVPTEHHLRFPIFLNQLPKDGLKKNMSKYKEILNKFVKIDKKVNREFTKTLSLQVNSKTKCKIPKLISPQMSCSNERAPLKESKQKRLTNFAPTKTLRQKHLSLTIPKSSANKTNKFMLEKVIKKYIKNSLRRDEQSLIL